MITWRDTRPKWLIVTFLIILILPYVNAILPFTVWDFLNQPFDLVYEFRLAVYLYVITRIKFEGRANFIQLMSILLFVASYFINIADISLPLIGSLAYVGFVMSFMFGGKYSGRNSVDYNLILFVTIGLLVGRYSYSYLPLRLAYSTTIITSLGAMVFLYRRYKYGEISA